MNTTEKVIIEQFPYWEKAIAPIPAPHEAELMVFVGCGTSYNLALSLAALSNMRGRPAIRRASQSGPRGAPSWAEGCSWACSFPSS